MVDPHFSAVFKKNPEFLYIPIPFQIPGFGYPRIWSLNKTSSQCMAKDSSEKRSHACCFTSAPSHITKKNETNGGRNLNYGSAMAKRRRSSSEILVVAFGGAAASSLLSFSLSRRSWLSKLGEDTSLN